jgi:hypothetical protein
MIRRRIVQGQVYVLTRRGWRLVLNGYIRTRKGWRKLRPRPGRRKQPAASPATEPPAPIAAPAITDPAPPDMQPPPRPCFGRYAALRAPADEEQ